MKNSIREGRHRTAREGMWYMQWQPFIGVNWIGMHVVIVPRGGMKYFVDIARAVIIQWPCRSTDQVYYSYQAHYREFGLILILRGMVSDEIVSIYLFCPR